MTNANTYPWFEIKQNSSGNVMFIICLEISFQRKTIFRGFLRGSEFRHELIVENIIRMQKII
jgi:hypothetical protein